MRIQDLEDYKEYIFSAALKKCQNLEDAQDLTQEVFLAAMDYQKSISNIKSWLSAVLNNKYNDMLRKKYKLPTISIDLVPEPSDESQNDDRPDAAQVRREIAYLSERYREVIVRHYFHGEKIQDIADDLGVPKGTILSRLASGRAQMRKGFDEMESYEKQSYHPERLEISFNGSQGTGGEPQSLVNDDLMKQNILIAAYEKPLTCDRIARSLGIPAAYIERAADSLVTGQLMTRAGNKIFTDFMITSPDEILRALDSQIEFTDKHFDTIWGCITEAVASLETLEWYRKLTESRQNKCACYYMLHIFSTGIFTALRRLIPAQERFPYRPDGGRWIALGNRYPMDFDFDNYRFRQYCYGGERRAEYENFLGEKTVCLRVYDTQPDLNRYEHGPTEIHDDKLCALLYLIYKGIPADAVAFEPVYLQAIPHLADCGIFTYVNGKPSVDIPVISGTGYREMDSLRVQYAHKLSDLLAGPLEAVLPLMKLPVPAHLEDRITEFRKYACYAIPMAAFRQAIANNAPLGAQASARSPMLLVIEH
ncbi:MAG: RNA polymerase sigma factor [Eubacteriales bacterium]|nr:RNA polymerase sigma factor [Eubacteriales bacterium]